MAFDDTWRWHEAIDDFDAVARHVSMGPTMEGLRRMLGDSAEMAYLSYMANRLRECRRVLKRTGSIYLHCDPTMNYLLRMVMNAVFGKENYRNEIVWSYRRWPAKQRNFQRMHDTIYRYSRSESVTWNQLYEPLAESTLESRRRQEDPECV